MEQSNNGADFTSKSLQNLKNVSLDWNLNGDRALLEILENIHKDVITKVNNTNENHEKLAINLNKASISLININNRFSELCNTQFIENKVQEDDITVNNENSTKSHDDNTQKSKDDTEIKEHIVTAISKSLQELKGLCDEISLSSDSDSESDDSENKETGHNSVILKPKDLYADNYLPHIIGSQKWKNKWHIGLNECSSESEFDESESKPSPPEEYSSLEESTKESLRDDHDYISNRKKQLTLPITLDNNSSDPSMYDDNISDRIDPEEAIRHPSNVKNDDVTKYKEPKAPQILVAPSDFAAELARKLGTNPTDPLPIATKPIKPIDNTLNQKPKNKQSIYDPGLSEKPTSRVTGNIFSDEPPPLESYDDQSSNVFNPTESTDDYVSSGLFGDIPDTPPQSNKFSNADLFTKKQTSNYGGLFDDVPDDSEMFGAKNDKKKQTLFKSDDDDMFGSKKINKNTQSVSNASKPEIKKDNVKNSKINTTYKDESSLFDDYDADSDDNLFGSTKKIQTTQQKPEIKSANVKKVNSLFDDYSDSDDDLFGTKSTIVTKSANPPKKIVSESKKNVNRALDSDDDLFGSNNTTKSIINKIPTDSKPESLRKSENTDTLFEDNKTLSNPAVIKKDSENKFLTDSDDDLFGFNTQTKNKENKTSTAAPKKPNILQNTDTLFEDNEPVGGDDDLFGFNDKKKINTTIQKPDNSNTLFEEKSIFTDDKDSDDDLFGSNTTKKINTINRKPEILQKPEKANTLFEENEKTTDNDLFETEKKINTTNLKPENLNTTLKELEPNEDNDLSGPNAVETKNTINEKPENSTVLFEEKNMFADDKDSDDDLFGSNTTTQKPQILQKPETLKTTFDKTKTVITPMDNKDSDDKSISDSDNDLFGSNTNIKNTENKIAIDSDKKPEILQKPEKPNTFIKKTITNEPAHDDVTDTDELLKSDNKTTQNVEKPEILQKPEKPDILIKKPTTNKTTYDVSDTDELFKSDTKTTQNVEKPEILQKPENKITVDLPKKPEIRNKPENSNKSIKPKKIDDRIPPVDENIFTKNNINTEIPKDTKENSPKLDNSDVQQLPTPKIDFNSKINLANGLFDDIPPPLENISDADSGQNDEDDLFSSFGQTKVIKTEDKPTSSALFDNHHKVDLFSDEPPDYTSQTIDNNSASDYSDIYADYPYYKTVNRIETSNEKKNSDPQNSTETIKNNKANKDSLFYDSDDDLFKTTTTDTKKPSLVANMSISKTKPITASLPPINRNKPLIEEKIKPAVIEVKKSSEISSISTEETDGLNFSKSTITNDEKQSPQRKVGKLNMNLNINVQALLPSGNKTVKEIEKSTKKIESPPDVVNDDSNTSNSFDESNTNDKNETNTLSNSAIKDRVKIQVKRRPPTRKARHDAARKSAADIYNFGPVPEPENTTEPEFIYSLPNSPVKEQNNSKIPEDIPEKIEPKPVVKVTESAIKKKTVNNLFSDSDSDSDLFNAKPKSSNQTKKIIEKAPKKSIFDDDADDLFNSPKEPLKIKNTPSNNTKKSSGLFDDNSDDEFDIFNTKKESKKTILPKGNETIKQLPKTNVKTSNAEISFKDPLSSFLDD